MLLLQLLAFLMVVVGFVLMLLVDPATPSRRTVDCKLKRCIVQLDDEQ